LARFQMNPPLPNFATFKIPADLCRNFGDKIINKDCQRKSERERIAQNVKVDCLFISFIHTIHSNSTILLQFAFVV
jgi:hypothetical protein